MSKVIREPLVHFLLIGLAIFGLFGLVNDDTPEQDTIVLADNDLRHLVEIWKLQWRREPTEKELLGLIEERIKQEVLYREALKMNLDQNDEVVKRRLVQKMDFLSDDINALVNAPSDEQLKQYLEENVEKYQMPFRYTFYQVGFSSDRNQDAKATAQAFLDVSKGTPPQSLETGGDLRLFAYRFDDITAPRLNAELGGEIAKALETLPLNEWVGPVASGYGQHLVFITSRTAPEVPPFEEVRDKVARDYEFEKSQESQQEIYRSLLQNYDIQVRANLPPELLEQIVERVNG